MLCCYIPITNLRHDLLRKKYLRILADKSKFNVRRFYTYGEFNEATIITDSKIEFEDGKAKIIY